MGLREAAQMALDAMLNFPDDISDDMFESIKALRAALAQPEQEPVAWMFPDDLERFQTSETFAQAFSVACGSPTQGETLPLYTAPPQREWQGLTDEEIMKITGVTSADSDWNVTIVHKWIRAIEAKLREKNFDRPS